MNFHVTRMVGGVIDQNVILITGGVSLATFEGVSPSLKLFAAISGPLLLFPFFLFYFLMSGGQIQFEMGLEVPDDTRT